MQIRNKKTYRYMHIHIQFLVKNKDNKPTVQNLKVDKNLRLKSLNAVIHETSIFEKPIQCIFTSTANSFIKSI